MRFSTIVALVATAGLVAATPSPAAGSSLVARAGDGSVELAKRSGCGSTGPLGTGHFKWWIVVSCTPGAEMTCQATDASGCVPGDTKHIGSMEVDVSIAMVAEQASLADTNMFFAISQDPNDTVNIAKASNTNTLPFTCPSGGQVRCEANFNDNDDGPGYSLRGKPSS
ncbi:hypothetical protein ACG7TL_005195 [Trametes sanguinea]